MVVAPKAMTRNKMSSTAMSDEAHSKWRRTVENEPARRVPGDPTPQPANDVGRPADENTYKGVKFDTNSRFAFFRVFDKLGASYLVPYSQVGGGFSPRPGELMLHTALFTFTFKGRNLEIISQMMSELHLKELREFSPERDELPEGEEPVITSLTVVMREG
jgi:hypothetical protein